MYLPNATFLSYFYDIATQLPKSWETLNVEKMFQRYKAKVTNQECFWRMTYFPFSSFFAVLLYEQHLSFFSLKSEKVEWRPDFSNWEAGVMKMVTNLQIK